MNGYTTIVETANATLAAADLHRPINGIRFQVIRRFSREGAVSKCWSNKTICTNLEPSSCFRRHAKVLGLLIPASCARQTADQPSKEPTDRINEVRWNLPLAISLIGHKRASDTRCRRGGGSLAAIDRGDWLSPYGRRRAKGQS
jgi:hypothetical protein